MNSIWHGNRDSEEPRSLPSQADVRTSLHLTALAGAENVRILRNELHRWLALDVGPDQAGDLLLAAYEAMANSVEHAYARSDFPGVLKVSAHRRRECVFVRVSDRGCWSEAPSAEYRGRGLTLMRSLLDEVRVKRTSAGTTVEMTSRIV